MIEEDKIEDAPARHFENVARENRLYNPTLVYNVVVTYHDSFGISCRTAGVDEGAAVAGPSSQYAFGAARPQWICQFKKTCPCERLHRANILGIIVVPHDDSL